MVISSISEIPDFDTRFGLGSRKLACGEEDIFLYDSFRRGLSILYVPKPIVETPRNTTGGNFLTSAKVQRSKGAVWGYMYGIVPALLRCLEFAFNLPPSSLRQRVGAFYQMAWGVFYINTSRNGKQ